jgi:hypothetical protein
MGIIPTHFQDFTELCIQEFPMIVITARPRYEFKSKFYPVHLDGGSHGSLHKYDSTIPLIITGTEYPINEPPRLIDLKNFVINLFEEQALSNYAVDLGN